MSNHKPKTDSRVLTVGLLISVLICVFFIYTLYLLIFMPPSLPPGAVFETNDVKEWRVVLVDGAIVPSPSLGAVASKKEAATWAWAVWKDKHSPTNKGAWRVVK